MSCFNSIANCCPTTPPPVDCCIELSDLSTLFPNGASLVVGSATFVFPTENWYKEGCCLSNTVSLLDTPAQQNCTSDWTYQASETIKCHTYYQKTKIKRVNFPEPPNFPDPCQYNECEDVLLGATTTATITERGERVVYSKVKPFSATLVVGKFPRTCEYGTTVCTYVVAIVITYAVYSAGKTQGYKTYDLTLDYYADDLNTACNENKTLEQRKAEFDIHQTCGVNDFPLCNYIDFNPPGWQPDLVTISRGKLLTNWSCPIVFNDTDKDLDFCDWAYFCADPTGEQGPITITFNRTLPPVYVGINPQLIEPEWTACCHTLFIDSNHLPKRIYWVSGPNKKPGPTYWTANIPPGGTVLTTCDSFDNSLALSHCYGFSYCYYIPQGNEVYSMGFSCCDDNVLVGIPPLVEYYGQTFSDHSFSYNSVTDPTPIVHTYNIPAWTLNC